MTAPHVSQLQADRDRSPSTAAELSRQSNVSVPVIQLWKTNFQESLGDWIIEVHRCDPDALRQNAASGILSADVYQVHQSVLVLGPRASLYFAQECLLATSAATTAASPTRERPRTVLRLPDCLANVFPDLLDYMYNGECRFTTGGATALYVLAGQLQVSLLQTKVDEFINRDMTASNLDVYYTQAHRLQQTHLLDKVMSSFCQMIHCIAPSSSILKVADPDWMLRVVDTVTEPTDHLRALIMAYCRLHERSLTPSQWLELTDVL
jgi:BTB/POZ domain